MTDEQCDSCIYKKEDCYGFVMDKLIPLGLGTKLKCGDYIKGEPK